MSFLSVVDELHAAGCVFAEDEAELLAGSARSDGELEAMVARRVAGAPLEHVVGWAEFCGLRVAVGPGVFVPRPRSAFLAHLAAAVCPPHAVVVDLCCGSGAVGAYVAGVVSPAELHASDVDPAAVACAWHNVEPLGGQVHEGDLFDALPGHLRGRVDVLVANVPYVPSDQIALLPQEAREHEPIVALDGGADGFDVLRRVLAAAPGWIAPCGVLLVELSERQAPDAARLFVAAGLAASVVASEEWDTTVVLGRPCSERVRAGGDEAREQMQ